MKNLLTVIFFISIALVEKIKARVKEIKIKAVAFQLLNILPFAMLIVGGAFAAIIILDAKGDEKCAKGEWHGEELCPSERATGKYGDNGVWKWKK